ncbi:metal-sulfur cluster assembly factor [Schaalia suimastitidis]|uniref:metal-sulfur cluster assembly factor n=1 Tax=Schaalia suimastitidis TaxID=121163 RepID=UPI00041FDFC0|nr:metal-sulfur cluster assembly factor [Schaalia suimastitidis]
MNNPMAQSDPVEQRFAPVAPVEHDEAVRTVDGTDLIENGTFAGEDIMEALRDVIDPELGINIVDLGLLYGVTVNADDSIVLNMTLTSAACPLTDVIERQAQMVLATMTPDVAINWVWMPPWGPDRITPDGRDQLRAIGFNV